MSNYIQLGGNELEKHKKYETQYKLENGKLNIFWGIGIENEVYLEFDKKVITSKTFFISNHKRERYSIDYYNNYKKEYQNNPFEIYFDTLINNKNNNMEIIKLSENNEPTIDLPLFLNSHSFEKTDIYNQPKTLYTKDCEPNPNFSGKTLMDVLRENNQYFEEREKWLFDGDTVEFINIYFYKKKLKEILNEINNNKKEFLYNLNTSLQKLNIFPDYGNLNIMNTNHPFTLHMTNLKNVSIFNNGTLHYNITLPTELDENCKIKNMEQFIKENSRAIKLIQYMEPFLLVAYGSKDVFSTLEKYSDNKKFSACSQRCAVSRYIGIGTYDCNKMETGKILKKNVSNISCSSLDYWWFNKYYENNAYTKLDEIGLDINFNKHYNHGIELRFFDHISDNNKIIESFEFIVFLMDYILENDFIQYLETPSYNRLWNNIVLQCMYEGGQYIMSVDEIEIMNYIFKIKITAKKVINVYYEILWNLKNKFCKRIIVDYNKYIMKPIGKMSSLVLEDKIIQSAYIERLEDEGDIMFYNNIKNDDKNNIVCCNII
jgi:hypothetical protein